jgi:hypothetical protein
VQLSTPHVLDIRILPWRNSKAPRPPSETLSKVRRISEAINNNTPHRDLPPDRSSTVAEAGRSQPRTPSPRNPPARSQYARTDSTPVLPRRNTNSTSSRHVPNQAPAADAAEKLQARTPSARDHPGSIQHPRANPAPDLRRHIAVSTNPRHAANPMPTANRQPPRSNTTLKTPRQVCTDTSAESRYNTNPPPSSKQPGPDRDSAISRQNTTSVIPSATQNSAGLPSSRASHTKSTSSTPRENYHSAVSRPVFSSIPDGSSRALANELTPTTSSSITAEREPVAQLTAESRPAITPGSVRMVSGGFERRTFFTKG